MRRPALNRPRRPAAWLQAVVLVVLALALGACETVEATAETVRSIQEETGRTQVQVDLRNQSGGAVETVHVEYATEQTDEQAVRDEADRVAEIVWEELPVRFEQVVSDPQGDPAGVETVTYTRQELEQRLGPRDPDLDQSITEAGGPILLTVVGVALAVIVLVVVIVVVLVRRRDKRRGAGGSDAGAPPAAGGAEARSNTGAPPTA